LKPGPEKELAGDYMTRATAMARQMGIRAVAVTELPESGAKTASLRQADEADRLLSGLHPDAFLIVLDERGKEMTSEALAAEMGLRRDRGTPELAFFIGGPDGHGEAVRKRANLVLAFGKLTWPHRLMRILLAEQVYRALTILANHPYHRA
jgi:23S rRNA (pseudouridine1915-N3)-methyltransferase